VPFAYRQLFQPDAATRDRALHVQSVLDRRLTNLRWRVDGGYTERFRDNDTAGISAITADRLTDGPISAIPMATGHPSAGRWTLKARIQPRPPANQKHLIEAGASVERTFVNTSDQFSGTIGELVDRTPARMWFFDHPDVTSSSHATTLSVFATD